MPQSSFLQAVNPQDTAAKLVELELALAVLNSKLQDTVAKAATAQAKLEHALHDFRHLTKAFLTELITTVSCQFVKMQAELLQTQQHQIKVEVESALQGCYSTAAGKKMERWVHSKVQSLQHLVTDQIQISSSPARPGMRNVPTQTEQGVAEQIQQQHSQPSQEEHSHEVSLPPELATQTRDATHVALHGPAQPAAVMSRSQNSLSLMHHKPAASRQLPGSNKTPARHQQKRQLLSPNRQPLAPLQLNQQQQQQQQYHQERHQHHRRVTEQSVALATRHSKPHVDCAVQPSTSVQTAASPKQSAGAQACSQGPSAHLYTEDSVSPAESQGRFLPTLSISEELGHYQQPAEFSTGLYVIAQFTTATVAQPAATIPQHEPTAPAASVPVAAHPAAYAMAASAQTRPHHPRASPATAGVPFSARRLAAAGASSTVRVEPESWHWQDRVPARQLHDSEALQLACMPGKHAQATRQPFADTQIDTLTHAQQPCPTSPPLTDPQGSSMQRPSYAPQQQTSQDAPYALVAASAPCAPAQHPWAKPHESPQHTYDWSQHAEYQDAGYALAGHGVNGVPHTPWTLQQVQSKVQKSPEEVRGQTQRLLEVLRREQADVERGDLLKLPAGIPLTPVLPTQVLPRDSLEASIWKLSSASKC